MKASRLLLISVMMLSLSAFTNDEKYNSFLLHFRSMYETRHSGKHLTHKEIDLIASNVWEGSGQNWLLATTTACQGLCETHYNLADSSPEYRGHFGMKTGTIIAEGIRTGIIKKGNKKQARALLDKCLKDPFYADKLSASRLVYLVKKFEVRKVAVFEWVHGDQWRKDKTILKDAHKYFWRVEKSRRSFFGNEPGVPLENSGK